MRAVTVLALFLLLVVGAFPVQMQAADTQTTAVQVPDTQTIDITSTTNGRDYRIWVALPESYAASDETYPVLYLLESQVLFLSTTEFVRIKSWVGELPEMIVVGIGYQTETIEEALPFHEQDTYIAPDEFLAFIADELIPLIESSYRADSADRALVGEAGGGEFVFHTLASRADLFNRYIALDSAATALMPYLMRDDDGFRSQFAGRDVRLFTSALGEEVLSAAISRRAYDGLTATGLSLGDMTHAQGVFVSLPAGIAAVYAE